MKTIWLTVRRYSRYDDDHEKGWYHWIPNKMIDHDGRLGRDPKVGPAVICRDHVEFWEYGNYLHE